MSRVLFAISYVVGTFAILPYTRRLVDALRERNLLRLSIITLCAAIGGVLYRRFKARVGLAYGLLLLAVIGAVYGGAFLMIPIPEERLHLVQYGILVPVLVGAFELRMPRMRALAAAAILGALIGIADENAQRLLPNRFFDLRDIAMNVGGVGLGTIALFAIERLAQRAQAAESTASHRSVRQISPS